jgi:hypothetical protein
LREQLHLFVGEVAQASADACVVPGGLVDSCVDRILSAVNDARMSSDDGTQTSDEQAARVLARVLDYDRLKPLDAYWRELGRPLLADCDASDVIAVTAAYARRRLALGATSAPEEAPSVRSPHAGEVDSSVAHPSPGPSVRTTPRRTTRKR